MNPIMKMNRIRIQAKILMKNQHMAMAKTPQHIKHYFS